MLWVCQPMTSLSSRNPYSNTLQIIERNEKCLNSNGTDCKLHFCCYLLRITLQRRPFVASGREETNKGFSSVQLGSGREMNKMSERVISRLSRALLAFTEKLLARVLRRRAKMLDDCFQGDSDFHFKCKEWWSDSLLHWLSAPGGPLLAVRFWGHVGENDAVSPVILNLQTVFFTVCGVWEDGRHHSYLGFRGFKRWSVSRPMPVLLQIIWMITQIQLPSEWRRAESFLSVYNDTIHRGLLKDEL